MAKISISEPTSPTPGQKANATSGLNRSTELVEAHALLNDANQREKTSQDELTCLRKQIDALQLQNDAEKQHRCLDHNRRRSSLSKTR